MTAYKLRLATADDHASIYSDWLRSARKSRTYGGVSSQVFYFWMHLTIEVLLADPGVAWIVACSNTDPTKIYGWMCGQRADTVAGDQGLVHYVYVKKLYRRMGIAEKLIKDFVGSAGALVVTSMTDAGRALLRDALYVFNPFLLFARTPEAVTQHRKNHPTNISRRALSRGGYIPDETGPEDE